MSSESGVAHSIAVAARALDDIQYSLEEGPCYDTLQEANAVVAPDLASDRRWPRYVPAAVEVGGRSQLAIKDQLRTRLRVPDEGLVSGAPQAP